MATLQMNKISICAIKKDRKKILEFLQRQGCVEVCDTGPPDEVFGKEDTSGVCAILEKNSQTASTCIAVLDKYCPEKHGIADTLKGRKTLTVDESANFEAKRNEVLKAAQRVIALDRSIAEAKAELLRLEAQEEALAPWLELPVPLSFRGTKRTAVFIGAVEDEHTLESLLARISGAAPELDKVSVHIVSVSKIQTCFYLITLKKDAALAEEALRNIGFVMPASQSHKLPSEKKEQFAVQKEQLHEKIRQAKQEIAGYASMRESFRFLDDHMRMRNEKYAIIQRLSQSKHAFVLSGYIPEPAAAALCDKLQERFDCAVAIEPAGDDAPVALKNARFFEPAEPVLESYSLPGHGEIDPTPVMSIFYYIMFGLMLSDAGYGLVAAVAIGVCLLMFKNMEASWRRNLTLFFWCAVSTVVWGVLFASYFGDVVSVVSSQFFGSEAGIPPVWFAPLDRPMQLLIFCLGIGCLHLATGYVLKACNLAKARRYADIVYDAVFPVAILVCLLLVLMCSEMFETMAGFRLTLGQTAQDVCMGIALVCMAGIVLTGGRESRSWGKRILKGLYALYNVLAGWLGDILSYSRLLALGLATGVIASVINAMGAMGGSGIAGAIIFCIVFVVGHALNLAINALGAYVHSNRLEYVEFFSKFYEGGGRKFMPYGMHTKYYRIVEEERHV